MSARRFGAPGGSARHVTGSGARSVRLRQAGKRYGEARYHRGSYREGIHDELTGLPLLATRPTKHHSDSPHPTIGFDNRRAMHHTVNYLHDLGHRNFAMIAGVAKGNDRAGERITGVVEALQKLGLHCPVERILQRPYAMSAGRDALRTLMKQVNRPTAVVCGNDVLATGALLEATHAGLRVPEDVSITGFDDLDLAKEIPPGLTTVHAPLVEMGQMTAQYFLKDVGGDDEAIHLELPAELVVRGSTGVCI